ncbi:MULTISPECIES: 3-hydroxyacyl-CoA dehydrogenase [unclassified Roseovarius]|uniref:3-hydroxyacyl-CoA dehydrogenase n=1 Tax=unclassified Roseovarius TaxID=2614913 RepID=UPI00273DF283|nr:3-hydroxyacyl-CoA dehydrogenase [Roseovarius sp. MMSF_3350]
MAADSESRTVGVVGAGAMGRGIAQVAATGGCRVILYDARAEATTEAIEFINGMLDRAIKKERMTADEAGAAKDRLMPARDMTDFSEADVVIEAVSEDMALKSEVFAALEKATRPDCILASNTSSLSITRLAAACDRPDRVAGFHFFNPVPLMPLVEVIAGIRTEPAIIDRLVELGKVMGRTPVRVADAPGFLVNQVGRGYTLEATNLVDEGVSTFADVDAIMRDAAGFRMGPFELLDLTALDVTHPATVEIYEQSYHEPRFRPAMLMGQRMQAGLLGRKTKQGHYVYEDGKQQRPEEPAAPEFEGGTFWVEPGEDADALKEIVTASGAELETGDSPGADAVILIMPLGLDATTHAARAGLDAARTVAVDPIFDFKGRRTVMKTIVTGAEPMRKAHAMLAQDGTPVTRIQDSPGFVAQRILAMICAIGASVAQNRIATPGDVDRAVKLGLNYPNGPLEFADVLGVSRIVQILDGMAECSGDPRHRVGPWLRRRAALGMSATTEETPARG